jgi:hypothetical protein
MPGEELRLNNLKEVGFKEVIYSSFLAMKERIFE